MPTSISPSSIRPCERNLTWALVAHSCHSGWSDHLVIALAVCWCVDCSTWTLVETSCCRACVLLLRIFFGFSKLYSKFFSRYLDAAGRTLSPPSQKISVPLASYRPHFEFCLRRRFPQATIYANHCVAFFPTRRCHTSTTAAKRFARPCCGNHSDFIHLFAWCNYYS